MLADQRRLRQRLRFLCEARGPVADEVRTKLANDIAASGARCARRRERLPAVQFDEELPVNARRETIAAAISAHQVVIVCGETGSGKTTQLPKICLALGRGAAGLIGHTQPRRIAARAIATYLARDLHGEVGGAVGCKVRFTDRTGPDTYIKVMTDGILLAETQGDRALSAYDTLIIDEAHERSLNIDFLLGYLRQLLPRRPDLKLIITSATIDPQRFARHFGDAPVVEVSGRTYPVEVRYRPPRAPDDDGGLQDQVESILGAVDELTALRHDGDILVFLPGERDIREAAEALRKHHPPHTEILPLYARLSAAEQERVFAAHTGRRIVLATNVAETSLTVPGIRYVVDTGRARISRYSLRAKVQRLPIEKISRASADQRKGRCGRLSDGVCIRLYAEDDYLARPEFMDPEIRRTNLASVILQMLALRLGEVAEFPFLDPPDPRLVNDGYRLLLELGAVDERRALTPLGSKLARLPIDPRFARLLLAAAATGALAEVLIIASALSLPDPRERPAEAQDAADQLHRRFMDERSDFLSYLKLWTFYHEAATQLSKAKLRKFCRDNFLSPVRLREWHDIHRQLHALVADMGLVPNAAPADYAAIHRALLAGLLGQVGVKTETQEYLGARQAKFFIAPGSGLFKRGPKWVMAAELVETARLYARCVAKVEPEWIEHAAGALCRRSYHDPHWEKKRAQVVAHESVTLYGLTLAAARPVHYGPINPAEARAVFIRGALVAGEYTTDAPFFRHNRNLIAEIERLEHKSRRADVLVDEERIFAFYDAVVPADVYNGAAFESWRKQAERDQPRLLYLTEEYLKQRDAGADIAEQFPDRVQVDGLTLSLLYHFEPGHAEDGVTVLLPLAVLNQVSAQRFEWLVPGLLPEKITALIKSLPKHLRRYFVPVPQYATACVEALLPADRPLTEALAQELHRIGGVRVPADAWRAETLAPHLHMNFRVVDETGATLAAGRDLAQLRAEFGQQARRDFGRLARPGFERDGIRTWDFDALPERIDIARDGETVYGYPALVDQGDAVALKLFDSAAAAAKEHGAGLRRLFLLALPQQAKYLQKNLPVSKDACLHHLPLGNCDALKHDLLVAVTERAFFTGPPPRTRAEFETRRDEAAGKLLTIANDLCRLAGEILAEYHGARTEFERMRARLPAPAVADIQAQLERLVYPGFVSGTPVAWLAHLPRYLKALRLRLQKLVNAPARDAAKLAEFAPLWRAYRDRAAPGAAGNAALEEYRWWLEELRVSLFAQELRTAVPVSVKRLQQKRVELD